MTCPTHWTFASGRPSSAIWRVAPGAINLLFADLLDDYIVTIIAGSLSAQTTLGELRLFFGGVTSVYVDAPRELTAGLSYNIDTTAGPFTCTLAAAAANAEITINDVYGTWSTNNFTLDPGALPINDAAPLDCNAPASLVLISTGTAWRIKQWTPLYFIPSEPK